MKGKKILIVDDEPDVVTYLAALFMDHGFSVLAASTGQEGFQKAKREQPDLISLDITMPEETGLRLYWDLQNDLSTCGIPVIIITGTPGEFSQLVKDQQNLKPPAGYFDKPINRDQLLNRIKDILEVQNKNSEKTL